MSRLSTSSTAGSPSVRYNKRRLLASENLLLGFYNYSIGHAYSVNGHASSLTYPNGSIINYFVNALGEQTRAGSYAYNVTRHPNGAVANFTYGNGIAHMGTQTLRTLPDLSSDASINLSVINDDYNWDANGNVSAILSGTGVGATRQMQYDARDRLTQTTFDKLGPAQVDFTYDPLDNLRTYSTPGRSYTHEYDSNWRLNRIRDPSQVSQYLYSYAGDAGNRGNVTTRFQSGSPFNNTQNYTFDQGNRLRAVAGSAAQTYTYDGMGRRTRVTTSPSVYRNQIYSQSGKLVYEHLFSPKYSGATRETSYIYLGNHLVGRMEGNVGGTQIRTYVHTDGLGSPVAETDTSGNMVTDSRSLYEPYGLLAYGPTAQRPGYTGHVRDAATGLNYMQQRYYDPIAGRFLSPDPVSADPSTGSNFNRYWYANNNPYKFVDPDGRDALWIIGSDGSAALTIPVNFTGSAVNDQIVAKIVARAESISTPLANVSISVIPTSVPINGVLNTMNLSPGFNHDLCGTAGECINKIGGTIGHINSESPQAIDAAVHDIFHFGGITDKYWEGPSNDPNQRSLSVSKPGYNSSHIMTSRRGTKLTSEDLGEAASSKTTKTCSTATGTHIQTCG